MSKRKCAWLAAATVTLVSVALLMSNWGDARSSSSIVPSSSDTVGVGPSVSKSDVSVDATPKQLPSCSRAEAAQLLLGILVECKDDEVNAYDLAAAWLWDMSEVQIEALLLEHTTLRFDDLEGVRDLRAFALELVRIAEQSPSPEAAPLEFASYVDRDNFPKRATTSFRAHSGRVFAVFPTESYGGTHVVVNWKYSGSRAPISMRRLPIDANGQRSSVWLRPPPSQEGWPTGAYQVGIFSDDGSHTPLAYGEYVVIP